MQAVLQDTSSVCLWLGANVMLEYPLQEAHDLLARNYENARTSLDTIKKDMLTLRDSITTTEARAALKARNGGHSTDFPRSQVSIARVYNDDVRRRREQGASKT